MNAKEAWAVWLLSFGEHRESPGAVDYCNNALPLLQELAEKVERQEDWNEFVLKVMHFSGTGEEADRLVRKRANFGRTIAKGAGNRIHINLLGEETEDEKVE